MVEHGDAYIPDGDHQNYACDACIPDKKGDIFSHSLMDMRCHLS